MKFFRILVDGVPRLGQANDDLVSGRLYPEGLDAFDVMARPRTSADGDLVDFRTAELLPPLEVTTIRDFITFEQHTVGALRSVAADKGIPDAWYDAPSFYFTNPHAATGHNATVPVAPGSHQFDFELEVAAVIGTDGCNLSVDEAEQHIAGYLIMNDWSARDLQRAEMTVGLGPAKGKDTATSLGPIFVTKDELADITSDGFLDLSVSVSVNGQVLAADSLANMAWNFAELVSYASRGTWVRRGDILGSGTSGGGCLAEFWGWYGSMTPPPLQRDDVVSLTVERLGTLTNVIGDGAPVHRIPKARGRAYGPPVPFVPNL
ncbi:fumarylacetoacetate hydrolase family protein [Paenarthrobacter nitroguajacolicus]|uniref:Fumarylacetoacetate hydrolase family protein n=1 Tax=Paenarthrobacter nitroguajacolicus TaxID=211146 RepID=A0A558GWJ1_PAENT|nr:fumarylacetoacetate hydrolase family protein [Paenarthrobacter nitroguajacolicus]TVU61244.1 fumarylacetoacetate hydrolase family protein [Paenarthrobacter nitroguajacolicus]